ncbi:MAG: ABC transporter ATP-binding protein [Methylicorpusculum sp.]|uniref:ABC transporter ATP-binding protein n=1 Tax=Methylicorpusculum sp. TaxID=2713644 RepID=UPI00271BB07F|nr:ABC transporter ATP-binding protein [Methylicorpusculum sp.]MDO8938534.1 ABC transporter ATP-binding protein [Methylicorpusculum sp.]MDP2202084.1 ABC transporter ATP-binding protein [Methylicorpusculum sp.]
MKPIIEVNNLTKEYQLGHLTSLKESALNTLRRLTFRPVQERERFKALDDVNFHIEQGEVVGIIGHNGAGKSTLLKHLANISKPTKGDVIVRGSVAPLIEVGAGVNPELTGRENIFLNGAILGIPKIIIQQKLDEIIDFSELEQFIDTPVKRYSSGMTVRLGFSIATSMEADILIVDEVLAVGDLAFQRKCFDRMEDLIKRQGKTVLLVSHNIRQVERLCSRTILMSHGKITQDGKPRNVCNAFYEESDKEIQTAKITSKFGRTESSGDIELESITVLNNEGNSVASIEYLEDIEFKVTYVIKSKLAEPIFGLGIHTTDFLYLATSQSLDQLASGLLHPGKYTLSYKVSNFPFLPGIYSLRLGVALNGSFQPVFYSEGVFPLHVIASKNINRSVLSTNNEGFISLDGKWSLVENHSQ